MKKESYKYELALSYAHKDEAIASSISLEFQNIFQDRFFQDVLHPEDLAVASKFEERLKTIFNNSHYAVILYTENYQKGRFAQVELKTIVSRSIAENSNHFFILHLNDIPVKEKCIKGLTYINLPLKGKSPSEKKNLIQDAVHNKIKRCIIDNTLKNMEDTYSLSLRTLFAGGNTPIWETDYDWNLFTTEFIEPEGRKLRQEYKWDDLWNYVKSDFMRIYNKIKATPSVLLKINLNCHLSIAYNLGVLYGDLSIPKNRNLILTSGKNLHSIFDFRRPVSPSDINISITRSEKAGNNIVSNDIACIISLTSRPMPNLCSTVTNFLNSQTIAFKKLFSYSDSIDIKNTDELGQLSFFLHNQLLELMTNEKATCLHLFLRVPAALAFVLGSIPMFPGKILLYEYDQESNSYTMSLKRFDS